jgi:sporulation protein YlmC with PRC-barrel domain
MKNVKLTSLLCGGILSLAGSVLAQQSTAPGSSSSSSSTSPGLNQPAPGSSGAYSSGTAASSSGAMQSEQNVRLSTLINSPVQSKDGKQIGSLRDVTVDPKSGRIEFGILSLSSGGGTAGTSAQSSISGSSSTSAGASFTGKLIPVPWQLFSQTWSQAGATSSSSTGAMRTPLVLNVDESKLQSAPSFEASNWNEIQTGSFDQQVYSFFGVSRSSAYGTPGSSMSGHGASGTGYQHNNYGTQGGTPSGSTSGSTGTTPPR